MYRFFQVYFYAMKTLFFKMTCGTRAKHHKINDHKNPNQPLTFTGHGRRGQEAQEEAVHQAEEDQGYGLFSNQQKKIFLFNFIKS